MIDIGTINIYHLTDIDNLAGIVNDGGLKSDAKLRGENKKPVLYTNKGIKDARLSKAIPHGILGEHGNVGDYVPFYFCNKHPLLNEWKEKSLRHKAIYFVAKLSSIVASDNKWFFTNGNARTNTTLFYDELNKLDKLNWDGIQSPKFDREYNNDNRLAKYSEFLFRNFFPLELLHLIAVYDEKTKIIAEKVLQGKGIPVEIKRDWYS